MAYSQGDVVAHIAFLIQAQDGGYVLGGYINLQSNTPDKAWVLKTDPAGRLQWNNTYGGNCDDPPNRILSVEQTDHGGFICVGNVDGASLMQLDGLGDVQFTKTYSDLSLNFVVRTDDGGYLFVGNEHDVIKTDSNLEFLWQRTYSETYVSRALKDILDDGYLLYTSGGIMKVDSSGNVEWSKRYPASIRCLIQTEDKGFAYVSTRCEGMGVCYIWLVKIAPEPINQQTEPPPLEPLPTAWILIAVVIVAVMGIGLLVYLNKHKGWYLSKEKY